MAIYKIIEELRSTNSRLDKEAILKSNIDNELLKTVLVYALGKHIKFYQKKIPAYSTNNTNIDLSEALDNLSKLMDRTYTGNDAIAYLSSILSDVSVNDAKLIELIIEKDLKCGVSTSTVNKIWKGLIPEYPYQRCSLISDVKLNTWDLTKGVYSQLKADALFCNTNNYENGTVEMLTRNGEDIPIDKFPNIVKQIQEQFDTNTQIHGELMVKRDGEILPREISNGIINSVTKGGTFGFGEEPYLVVWDQVPLEQVLPKCSINIPYSSRFDNLSNQCNKVTDSSVELIETRICYTIEEIVKHFEEMIGLGLEGTVVKNPAGIWEDKTSKDQIKLKLEVDSIELEIVGFKEGKGKNAATFGSIECKSSDDKINVFISGFKDNVRLDLHNRREEIVGTIISVKANALTNPTKGKDYYSLFLPRFEGERKDKTSADNFDRIKSIFDSSIDKIKVKLLEQYNAPVKQKGKK